MIGVLRPKSPSTSSKGVRLGGGRFRGRNNTTEQRYRAQRCVGRSARQGPAEHSDDGDPTSPAPDLLLPSLHDDGDLSPRRSGRLIVAVVSSAGDGDELAELHGADVGTMCVAVARQSSKEASHAIWKSEDGGPRATNDGGTGGACPRLGVFRTLVSYARDYMGSRSEACLVLYCKLPGAIAAFPLGGPSFRLWQDVAVEDGQCGTRKENSATEMCWNLSEKGFKLLDNLELATVPGLPALARDMANDKSCLQDANFSSAASAAVDLGLSVAGPPVVMPRMAGVFFVHGFPAPSVSHENAARSGRAMVARLEGQGDSGMQHFVLEDCDVKCAHGKVAFSIRHSWAKWRRRRRVSLPVTYSALLDEAILRVQPRSGQTMASMGWKRFRGRRYSAGSTRVVPGLDDGVLIVDTIQSGSEPTKGVGKPDGAKDQTRRRPSEVEGGESGDQGRPELLGVQLTVHRVHSAPLSLVLSWASTRGVVDGLLAAACRSGGKNITGVQRNGPEENGGQARGAACTLLARVLGEDSGGAGGENRAMDTLQANTLLSEWYDSFWLSAAPFEGNQGLLQDSPRMLLQGMIELPAVREGFVQRGLVRHLAEGLHTSMAESHLRRHFAARCQGRDPSGVAGNQKHADPSTGFSQTELALPSVTPGKSVPVPYATDAFNMKTSPEQDSHETPWWHSEPEQEGDGRKNPSWDNSRIGGAGGDARGSTEHEDGCETASDELFDAGEKESAALTNREDDPTDDGGGNGNDPRDPGVPPISPPGECEFERRGEKQHAVGYGSGGGTTAKERVAPPMLRLYVLDGIFSEKGWGSPRCSPRAAVTLSAASTRAPARLPTFRSARGATSRASARHGSARSVRTGRTTQRDSASTGCPTGRSISSPAPADLEAPPTTPSAVAQGFPGDSRNSMLSPARSTSACAVDPPAEVAGEPQQALRGTQGFASLLPLGLDGVGTVDVSPACDVKGEDHGGGGKRGLPLLPLAGLPTAKETVEGRGRVFGGASQFLNERGQRDPRNEPGSSLASGVNYSKLQGGSTGGDEPLHDSARVLSASSFPEGSVPMASIDKGARGGYTDKGGPTAREGEGADQHLSTDSAEAADVCVCQQGQKSTLAGGRERKSCSCGSLLSSTSAARVFTTGDRGLAKGGNPQTNHTIRLAYASVPSEASPLEQASVYDGANALRSQIATAKLLVSLLSSTSVKRDVERALGATLDVFSMAGVIAWAETAVASTPMPLRKTSGQTPKNNGARKRQAEVPPENMAGEVSTLSWAELDPVDFIPLAAAVGASFDDRLSKFKSHMKADREGVQGGVVSGPYKEYVHVSSLLSLECTWLTRLLLHRIRAASALNEDFGSSLSMDDVSCGLSLCGHGLEVLRDMCLTPISKQRPGDTGPGCSSAHLEGRSHTTHDSEMLIMAAPMATDIAMSLIMLLGRPTVWGGNLAGSWKIIGSTALGNRGAIIPALVGLLERLVVSVTASSNDWPANGDRRRLPYVRPSPDNARIIERSLAEDERVLNHVLITVMRSLSAILTRVKALLETCEDAARSYANEVQWTSKEVICKGEVVQPGKEKNVIHGFGNGSYAPVGDGRRDAPSPRGTKKTEPTNGRGISLAAIKDTVCGIMQEMALAFQPEGAVLAVLNAQLSQPPLDGKGEEDIRPSTATSREIPRGGVPSAACLAATLRLSSQFFSLRARTRDVVANRKDRDEDNLDAFAAPLFTGFYKRCTLGGLGSEHGRQVRSSDRTDSTRVPQNDPLLRRRQDELLLCRLHLQALVELVSTRNPAVLKRASELRVTQFLVQCLIGSDRNLHPTEKSPRCPPSSAEGSRSVTPCVSSSLRGGKEGTRSGSLGFQADVGEHETRDEVEPTAKIARQNVRERALLDIPARLPPGSPNGTIAHIPYCGKLAAGLCGGGSGRPDRNIQASTGADSEMLFTVGERVDGLVVVRNKRPRWFPGRVKRLNSDGRLHVCYDDGDEELSKDNRDVRPRQPRRARAKPPADAVRLNSREREGALQAAYVASNTQQRGGDKKTMTEGSQLTPQPITSSTPESCHRQGPWRGLIAVEDPTVVPEERGATQIERSSGPVTSFRSSMDSGQQGNSPPFGSEKTPIPDTATGLESTKEHTVDTTTARSVQKNGVVISEDSEDDDMYFVIPSVLETVPAAKSVRSCAATTPSEIPRIDLQSSAFRTRVRSSQLGPGSSLSTPTTGGGGSDTLRGRGVSRSEASLAVLFPTAVADQRPRSFASRSPVVGLPRGSALISSSRSSTVTRTASKLPDFIRLSGATSRGESDSAIAGVSSSEDGSGQGMEDGDFQGSDTLESAGGRRAARRSIPIRETVPVATEETTVLSTAMLASSYVSDMVEEEVRVMQEYAVTLLLSLASATGDQGILTEQGSTMSSSTTGEERDGEGFMAGTMATLQSYLDDPQNALIGATLKTRWLGNQVEEAAPAVLTKLVCSAVFDAQSYSLGGNLIASGTFGGIIVSACPLSLRPAFMALGESYKANCANQSTPPETPSTALPTFEIRKRPPASAEHEEVALKVVDKDDFDNTIGPKIFLEVMALRALSGVPGVCRLYDFGVTPTSYVLVMERCEVSLTDWRARREGGSSSDCNSGAVAPHSEEEVALYLRMFRQIATAVAAMAARGVIHFDLKCDNVLVRGGRSELSPAGEISGGDGLDDVPSICVADFGESVVGKRRVSTRHLALGRDDEPRATESTEGYDFDVRGARGTERIQSPEMIALAVEGARVGVANDGHNPISGPARDFRPKATADANITAASDVWSLGCLLYELLAGKLLFEDLQWSEFFVMLTADEPYDEKSLAGGSEEPGAPGSRSSAIPLPPAASLHPFASLRSTETIKKLLESMLVRDALERPTAFQMIRCVDEALEAVVTIVDSSIIREGAGNGLPPGLGFERSSIRTSEKTDFATVARKTEDVVGGSRDETEEYVTAEIGIINDAEHATSVGRRPAKSDVKDATSTWPLQPCAAVHAHGNLRAKRKSLLRCAGCLYRLGSGAFLLTVSDSSFTRNEHSGGNLHDVSHTLVGGMDGGVQQRDPVGCGRTAHEEETRFGPATMVCCLGCDELVVEEADETELGGVSSSLGNVLPALGITHVVCVTPGLGERDPPGKWDCGGNGCSLPSAEKIEGIRLLNADVHRVDADNRDERNGSVARQVAERDACISGVLKFATGPRVLFVDADRDNGIAGALAMAWAMARTGKGSYETMVDFRQSCAGFWVHPDTVRSVIYK